MNFEYRPDRRIQSMQDELFNSKQPVGHFQQFKPTSRNLLCFLVNKDFSIGRDVYDGIKTLIKVVVRIEDKHTYD